MILLPPTREGSPGIGTAIEYLFIPSLMERAPGEPGSRSAHRIRRLGPGANWQPQTTLRIMPPSTWTTEPVTKAARWRMTRAIMTSLGPLTYRRPVRLERRKRVIAGARREPGSHRSRRLRRHRSADVGSLHGAGSGGVLRQIHDAVGEHPGASRTMHERWEALEPDTLDSIRCAEGLLHFWRSAPRCRSTTHGVGQEDAGQGLLARGRLRHGFLPRRQGRASEDPLSMGHACRRAARSPEGAAAQAKSQYQAAAPATCGIFADRTPPPRIETFLETLSARNRGHRLSGMPANILQAWAIRAMRMVIRLVSRSMPARFCVHGPLRRDKVMPGWTPSDATWRRRGLVVAENSKAWLAQPAERITLFKAIVPDGGGFTTASRSGFWPLGQNAPTPRR